MSDDLHDRQQRIGATQDKKRPEAACRTPIRAVHPQMTAADSGSVQIATET
jgi:hypothetical protein